MSISANQPRNLNLIFGSDSHDGFRQVQRFVSDVNKQQPDLVINGGDMTERGKPNELQATQKAFSGMNAPMVTIEGNHDYKGGNIDRFQSVYGGGDRAFDRNGVHIVTLNNADQTISQQSFDFLERDLAKNAGKPTVVAMHVPAVGPQPGPLVKLLNKLMPNTFAMPVVKDPAQVQRFTDLMSKHNVDLVLAGHTHIPYDVSQGGVRYVTAGAIGGKLPKPGLSHEYLNVAIQDGKVSVDHVALDKPTQGWADVASRMAQYFTRQVQTVHTGLPAIAKSDSGPLLSGIRTAQRGIGMAVAGLGTVPALRKFGYKAYGAISSGRNGGSAIENRGVLDKNLVRGAQPSEAGIATLKKQGVKTVINLRPESTWEGDVVQKAGLNYVHLPLPAIGKPTNEQAVQFLRTVTDPANGKVFFHCLHGADRTGAMAAVYRIAVQGKSADAAIAEMPKYRFHAGFEDAKTSFVKQFEGFWKGLDQGAKNDILHAFIH